MIVRNPFEGRDSLFKFGAKVDLFEREALLYRRETPKTYTDVHLRRLQLLLVPDGISIGEKWTMVIPSTSDVSLFYSVV